MDRYLIISADCHAGLPSEQYRDWLDPEHRGAFDEHAARRRAMIAQLIAADEDFATRWEEENAEGLRGAWDAARRFSVPPAPAAEVPLNQVALALGAKARRRVP